MKSCTLICVSSLVLYALPKNPIGQVSKFFHAIRDNCAD